MNAAILYQRGPAEEKQQQVCLDFIEAQHWDLRHVVPYWSPETAVALVAAGAIGAIVVACFQKALVALAADVGDRGTVIFVHPEPTVVKPPRRLPSVAELVRRMRHRGESTQEIAGLFEIDTGEVRRIIRGGHD